jgi:hypothetical protein
MAYALPVLVRPSIALALCTVGILLGGCRPRAASHPPSIDAPIPADTARWCSDAPTAQTVHAAACALRANERVAALRRRYPEIDFDRPAPALAIGVRPGELRFRVRQDFGGLDVTVAPGTRRPDPDPHPLFGPDTVLVATDSSRLRGARQSWLIADTAHFRRALAMVESGLARIGARLVGCRSWRRTGRDVDATYTDGERTFHLVASADTMETHEPLRLDVAFRSGPVDPDETFVRQPGCDAPTRTDFGPVIAAAYASADSPERLARRRRYFAFLCLSYRRVGRDTPPACETLRESEIEEHDREEFRRLFRRDSLTPPPAPPPIPASSR